jgi:hypothetical protein
MVAPQVMQNRSGQLSKGINGKVAGNSIRFEEPLGFPDGTAVEVVLRPLGLTAREKQSKLESLFGSCRGDAADLDAFLQANAVQRRLSRAGSEE